MERVPCVVIEGLLYITGEMVLAEDTYGLIAVLVAIELLQAATYAIAV